MHYYQFNIGDYASHTQRLSIYEDIAYRRLLDLYYLTERPLSGCSTDVAREIGMMDSLTDVEYVLNKFFIEEDGLWRNKRCDLEIKAYQNKRESASKAGKASGKSRRNKSIEQPLNDSSTESNDSSTVVEPNKKHKPITNKQNKELFVLPDNIDSDTWKAFQEHRRKLKAPMTDRAKTLMISKLLKLPGNPNAILNQSIENGWKGVFELKAENNGQSQQGNRSRTQQFNSELDRLAAEAIEKGETL